jgi:hypothetical protein
MSGTPHELVTLPSTVTVVVGVVSGVPLDVRDVRIPQNAAARRERESRAKTPPGRE